MIRDSDKCDIYEQVLESDGKLVFDGIYDKNANINKKVLSDFKKYKSIKTEDMKTVLDDYVRKEALIFGLYFEESLSYIYDNNYPLRLATKFLETFDFTNQETINNIKRVSEYTNEYIKNKKQKHIKKYK